MEECDNVAREYFPQNWRGPMTTAIFKIHLLLQNILQNLVRFNSKSVLCRKMFAQDFSFKIHFFKTFYKI